MITAEDHVMARQLAKLSPNESALRLALQLFGAEPCPVCDYRKTHCRCNKLTHALCLRAQLQCSHATKSVMPRFSPRYSTTHPPISGYQFSSRAWSDVLTRKHYDPSLGWMKSDDYFLWKAAR